MNKDIIQKIEKDRRDVKRIFESNDTFEEHLALQNEKDNASNNDTIVIIPPYDKENSSDIVLDKISFSQFIINLHHLDLLEITDMEASIAGECMFDLCINISANYSDDDTLKNVQLWHREIEFHRQVLKYQTFSEFPDSISCIPGFDTEQFFYESQCVDSWCINVKLTYDLKGGWYDENEERYTEYPDIVNAKIKEMYIQKGVDVSQYFVQNLLDDEAYKIIKELCEDYMTDNFEAIVN